MGRERHNGLPPAGKDIETVLLNRHPFDGPARIELRQRAQVFKQVIADLFLVAGDRFNIDERACKFKNIHSAALRESKGSVRGAKRARGSWRRSISIALHPVDNRPGDSGQVLAWPPSRRDKLPSRTGFGGMSAPFTGAPGAIRDRAAG